MGSTDFLDTYFTTNRKRLADAYVFTTTFLKKHGVNYVAGANAAFFLWVDLGTYYKHSVPGSTKDSSDVNTLITAKLRKKKVFVASGQAFGAEKPGWFRIVFSHPQEDLEEGMRRIVAAIGPSRAKL